MKISLLSRTKVVEGKGSFFPFIYTLRMPVTCYHLLVYFEKLSKHSIHPHHLGGYIPLSQLSPLNSSKLLKCLLGKSYCTL